MNYARRLIKVRLTLIEDGSEATLCVFSALRGIANSNC